MHLAFLLLRAPALPQPQSKIVHAGNGTVQREVGIDTAQDPYPAMYGYGFASSTSMAVLDALLAIGYDSTTVVILPLDDMTTAQVINLLGVRLLPIAVALRVARWTTACLLYNTNATHTLTQLHTHTDTTTHTHTHTHRILAYIPGLAVQCVVTTMSRVTERHHRCVRCTHCRTRV